MMNTDAGARTTATTLQRLGRREAIRRAALAGGALVWMAPAIYHLAASDVSTEGSGPPSQARSRTGA